MPAHPPATSVIQPTDRVVGATDGATGLKSRARISIGSSDEARIGLVATGRRASGSPSPSASEPPIRRPDTLLQDLWKESPVTRALRSQELWLTLTYLALLLLMAKGFAS